MKLSFTTLGCPDWSLEQIAANAKAYGYAGIELRTHADGNHLSQDASPEEARRVGRMFRGHGVGVMSVMGYARFGFAEAAEVEKNQALAYKLVALAQALEAPFVRVFAGTLPKGASHDETARTIGAALKPVAQDAARRKVKIGIETHDDWCGGELVLKLVKAVGVPKGFGIVYDVFNSFTTGIEPWNVTYRKVKPHICYCHIKDGYKDAEGKWRYVMVGAGLLPLEKIVGQLKKDGYRSFLSFEWEKKWHPELEPPERAFPHYVVKMRALGA